MNITVYTDGGCSGNPGPGGWAYIIRTSEGTEYGSGGDPSTTNNRMELTAVISALRAVRAMPRVPVTVHTDSRYVQLGISDWIRGWVRNGWKTSDKKPVKNRDLWQTLLSLTEGIDVTWRWVRGHDGVELNEECDAMVRKEIRALTG